MKRKKSQNRLFQTLSVYDHMHSNNCYLFSPFIQSVGISHIDYCSGAEGQSLRTKGGKLSLWFELFY